MHLKKTDFKIFLHYKAGYVYYFKGILILSSKECYLIQNLTSPR